MKNFIVALPGGFIQIGDHYTPELYVVKTADEATRLSESVALTIASRVRNGKAIQIEGA